MQTRKKSSFSLGRNEELSESVTSTAKHLGQIGLYFRPVSSTRALSQKPLVLTETTVQLPVGFGADARAGE